MDANQQFILALVVAVLGCVPSIVAALLSLRNGQKADATSAKVDQGNQLTEKGNQLTEAGNQITAEVKTLANGNLDAMRKALDSAHGQIKELSSALANAVLDTAAQIADSRERIAALEVLLQQQQGRVT